MYKDTDMLVYAITVEWRYIFSKNAFFNIKTRHLEYSITNIFQLEGPYPSPRVSSKMFTYIDKRWNCRYSIKAFWAPRLMFVVDLLVHSTNKKWLYLQRTANTFSPNHTQQDRYREKWKLLVGKVKQLIVDDVTNNRI